MFVFPHRVAVTLNVSRCILTKETIYYTTTNPSCRNIHSQYYMWPNVTLESSVRSLMMILFSFAYHWIHTWCDLFLTPIERSSRHALVPNIALDGRPPHTFLMSCLGHDCTRRVACSLFFRECNATVTELRWHSWRIHLIICSIRVSNFCAERSWL